jgi:hypothetical protein
VIKDLCLLSLAFFSLLFLSFSGSSPLPQSLQKYLPQESEIGDWRKDGPPLEYKGDDLFLYIDGGAEIYHEYGFKQVIVQDFRNRKGKSISLEIFKMSNAASAYGIYTFKAHPGGKELAIGGEARLADYYLNFWKGNFLVTLTGLDQDEDTPKGLEVIARAVEARIETEGKKPFLVGYLPKAGLFPDSVKYFRGDLGLYNDYPFFRQDVFALREGVKGDYQAGHSLYIVRYESDEESQTRLNEVKTAFQASERYKNIRSVSQTLFHTEDSKGKRIFVTAIKNYILIVIGAKSLAQAKEIFLSFQPPVNTDGSKKQPFSLSNLVPESCLSVIFNLYPFGSRL